MNLLNALRLWSKEVLAGPFRYLRAVLTYPSATFHPGVRIGMDCKFGLKVTVYAHTTIARAVVGDYSYIGGRSELKNCTLGKFCSVGPNVRIGLGMHPIDRVSTYPGFYSPFASGATKFFTDPTALESLPVTVGNDVWIGANAIINDGVTVGDGAVVAAGAVVANDVAPYSVVGGVPAKVIRSRFEQEMVDFLLDLRWWDLEEETLRKNGAAFGNPGAFRESLGRR